MATKQAIDPTRRKPGKELLNLTEDILKRDATRQAVFDEIDMMVDNRHPLPFPKSIPDADRQGMSVRSGMMAQVLNNIDGLFSGSPRISVFPDSISKSAAGTAEQIEDFLNAYFEQAEAERDAPLWDMQRKNVLQYGIGGGWKGLRPKVWNGMPPLYEADKKDKYDEQKKKLEKSEEEQAEFKQDRGLPIYHRVSHGPNIHPVYDDDGLAEVFEVYTMKSYEAAAKYPGTEFAKSWNRDKSAGTTDRITSNVRMLRHMNREWCSIAVVSGTRPTADDDSNYYPDNNSQELLRQYKHGLKGETPFTVMKGYTTTHSAPEKSTFGVLYELIEPVKVYDTTLSQRQAYIRMFAWPTPVIKWLQGMGPMSDILSNQKKLVWNEGEAIQLLPGQDISFLVIQGGGQELEAQLATLRSFIDRAGLASVSYGMSSSDMSSGYAISTLQQAATAKLSPLEKHLRQGHERDCRLILKYIIELDQEVYVFDRSRENGKWLSLSPKDLGGKLPQMASKIKADVKQDMQMLLQTAQIAKQEGFWSLTTAQEHIGVESPVREQKKVLIDQTLMSEEIRSVIANEGIKRTTQALEKEANKAPTPEMGAAATPAQQAALQQLALSGGSPVDPSLLPIPGGTAPAGAGPGAPGMGPVPGGNNPNVPPQMAGIPPNPAPPNAGGAVGLPPPVSPIRNSRRRGGRSAGSNRQPGGRQRSQ